MAESIKFTSVRTKLQKSTHPTFMSLELSMREALEAIYRATSMDDQQSSIKVEQA